MPFLRALIRENRQLALALLVTAIFMKAVIPSGFMLSTSGETMLTVTICSGQSGGLKQVEVAVLGKEQGGEHSDGMKKGEHCAFSGLAKLAVGGADAVLLALAFAFLLVLGLAPARRLLVPYDPYLRPPLRGPPAAA